MTINVISKCSYCGGTLKYYDKVSRIVKTKGGHKQKIEIRRVRCINCRRMHRKLPDFLVPYRHYESEIIKGVLDGFITSDTIGFEDYPCETTMNRWIKTYSDA